MLGEAIGAMSEPVKAPMGFLERCAGQCSDLLSRHVAVRNDHQALGKGGKRLDMCGSEAVWAVGAGLRGGDRNVGTAPTGEGPCKLDRAAFRG